ncbi:Dabb family protein [Yersinia enterocolitica]|nr:Dabb family protein [Yersinia enterocolitica]
MIKHILLTSFNRIIASTEIEEARSLFLELPKKITVINNIKWSINCSPEGLNGDFDYYISMKFTHH